MILIENMYIFFNGGDEFDGFGTVMYYRRNRLFLIVSIKIKEWIVETILIKVNVFFKVDFFWSEQIGFVLYLDNKEVAFIKIFVIKIVIVIVMIKFYIGLFIIINIYVNIVIDGWEVTEVTKEIRDIILVESIIQVEIIIELIIEMFIIELIIEMFIIELIIEMEISIFIFIGKVNEFLFQIEI